MCTDVDLFSFIYYCPSNVNLVFDLRYILCFNSKKAIFDIFIKKL